MDSIFGFVRVSRLLTVCLSVLLMAAGGRQATAQPAVPVVRIVAAENFYGDIARQIAGPAAQVDSILDNPDQDPHLFEVSPSTARRLSLTDVVIYNGLGYDPWMEKMLRVGAGRSSGPLQRQQIVVAGLMPHQPQDNPHLWYDIGHVRALARAVAGALQQRQPQETGAIDARLQAFERALDALSLTIAEMRQRYQGTPVTATEPVFGYMADALGLTMRHLGYQRAIMNESEPAPGDVVALEKDLRGKNVAVLFFNTQASGRAALRAQKIAAASGVPLVGISETMPPGSHYQEWMARQLSQLAVQLGPSAKGASAKVPMP